MAVQFRFGLLFCLILVIGVFFAGCSSESSDAVVTPAPTTVPAAKYSAGDIIAKTASGGESPLYVITKYDSAKEEYERAWIYKNDDGSWGHFIDSRTDRSPRSLIEKVYPAKVGHVSLSAIPIVTPTIAVATTTVASGAAPVVTAISPLTGTKDTPVTVSITGTDFQAGAQPRLIRPGSSPITATGVSVTSTRIDCTFSMNVKETGSYNVVVTNPDGQSSTLQRAFTVGDAAPIISGVSPSTMEINGQAGLTINGQNFKDGVKVILVRDGSEIPCVSPVSTYGTRITCDLDLNAVRNKQVTFGTWDVKVINIEGSQYGVWTKKFVIENSTSTES